MPQYVQVLNVCFFGTGACLQGFRILWLPQSTLIRRVWTEQVSGVNSGYHGGETVSVTFHVTTYQYFTAFQEWYSIEKSLLSLLTLF